MDYEKAYKEALEKARNIYPKFRPYNKKMLKEIFPELAESEDERIRKRLINLIKELASAKLPIMTSGYFVDGQDKDYVALLEKQKEPEVRVIIPKFRVGDVVKSISQPSLLPDKIKNIGKDCYWTERGCIGFAWEKDYELVEQKPAEWSEEDEEKLLSLIDTLRLFDAQKKLRDGYANSIVTWLKSLRPQSHWKPSEYQLEVLKLVAEKDGTCLMGLYNDLKKL